jgi:hypothetical protein
LAGGTAHADTPCLSRLSAHVADPQATLPAMLKIIDAEHPPLRIFLGTEGMPVVRAAFAERLAHWEAWEATSNAAQVVSRKLALDFG